jgi:hypothetical protein
VDNKLFKAAVERAYLKLSAMDNAEFEALLLKNQNGDYAKIVRETNFPGVGIYETAVPFKSGCYTLNFDTYILTSKESFKYVLDSTKAFIIPDSEVLTYAWTFTRGSEQITNANDWNIHEQDYSWAMAA